MGWLAWDEDRAACSRPRRQAGVTLMELAGQVRIPTSNLALVVEQGTSRAPLTVPAAGEANTAPRALTEQGRSALEHIWAARREGARRAPH